MYVVLLSFKEIQTSGFECYDFKRRIDESHGIKTNIQNPKKQVKIIKYCISKLTIGTKDKENEVIGSSGPKESKKTIEKACRVT